ncbi:AraC family two component transcriptional regulator [Melghirimyces profundicolus]|uniref:AraC family two component transcriptional regulator n=1 Tax=Melghirimyces profundicolus TaxID=1242148 RepID=A0A2T6C0F6_9BACL|nr:helix-turn-helix domain-containing protein [Melghirimyces profundicolus]PTX61805.1 AraC family two component transcriptional regulator [Melghirimyces profundicolus]
MAELLVVDNEIESRQAVCSIVEGSQYHYLTIYEAETVSQGISILKRVRPNVVIMDLSLPDQDGFVLGKMALDLYPQIPIIVLTQLKLFHTVQTCINIGFSAYLLKPVLKSELLSVFDRWMIREMSKEVDEWIPKNHISDEVETDFANPIQTALRYIQAKYQKPITLKEVANHVYLSPSHFSRLFKSETGVTFIEYLTRYRVEKSKGLLKMTSLPVEVISDYLGFTSAGYFSTTFKRLEGKTPSEYRKIFSKFKKPI